MSRRTRNPHGPALCQRLRALIAVAVVAVLAPTASAQAPDNGTFYAETFESLPAPGLNILNVSESIVLPHLSTSVGMLVHYADDPLTAVDNSSRDQVVMRLIDNQLTADFSVGVGLFNVASLSVVLPFTVDQEGDDLRAVGRPGQMISGTALGDLRVIPKIKILDHDDFGGFGMHLIVPIGLPTGDKDSFKSDGAVRVQPTLGLDWRHDDSGFAVAINAGFLLRPQRTSHNYVSGNAVRYALGLQIPTFDGLKLVTTIFGGVNLEDSLDPTNFTDTLGESVGTTLEALGGIELSVAEAVVISAGAGGALIHGVGTPDIRGFFGIAYSPGEPQDVDGDGFRTGADDCPDDPEDFDGFEDDDGCPEEDNDEDGKLDWVDECPNAAEDLDGFEDRDGCPDYDNDNDKVIDQVDACPMNPEDRDGFEDGDGCPDPDNDGDGILDGDDKCPDEAEDVDGLGDEDGCPELDFDGDGIPDTEDDCPRQPETPNDMEDEDGCPDITADGIELDGVKFTFTKPLQVAGKRVNRRSEAALDTLARELEKMPFMTKLRVEAHTDSAGTEQANIRKSQRQADAVMKYLVERGGLPAARLEAVGYGEAQPIADNKTPTGRRANRRIVVTVIEANGVPLEP